MFQNLISKYIIISISKETGGVSLVGMSVLDHLKNVGLISMMWPPIDQFNLVYFHFISPIILSVNLYTVNLRIVNHVIIEIKIIVISNKANIKVFVENTSRNSFIVERID